MPRLLITIDELDGSSRVVGPIHADEIDLSGLLMRLSQHNIAGVTFTNAESLKPRYLDQVSKPK